MSASIMVSPHHMSERELQHQLQGGSWRHGATMVLMNPNLRGERKGELSFMNLHFGNNYILQLPETTAAPFYDRNSVAMYKCPQPKECLIRGQDVVGRRNSGP